MLNVGSTKQSTPRLKSKEEQNFKVFDRVMVNGNGNGTIVETWEGSKEEQTSKKYGLPKFKVSLDDGGNTWFYDTDLVKLNSTSSYREKYTEMKRKYIQNKSIH